MALVIVVGLAFVDCGRRESNPDEPQSGYRCSRSANACSCERTNRPEDEGACGAFPCCYSWINWDFHNRADSGCYCRELDAATKSCPPPRNPADSRHAMCPP